MAPTDDRSASSMPLLLVAVAAILLSVRLGCTLAAMAETKGAHAQPLVWNHAEEYATLPPPSDKLVIYQFYADWSDACKLMEASALSNSQIKSTIDEHFLPVRIYDAPKGKNPQWVSDLEKRYRIFALPTLVVVDGNGKQIGSLIGNCTSLTTYRFLSRALHKHACGTTQHDTRPPHRA